LKRLLVITVTLALLMSFAQAPFAHIHHRDPVHRHATAMPHAHLRLLSDRHLAVRGPDDDDDVQPVDWVVITGDSAEPLVAIVSEPVVIPVAVDLYELVRAPSPRAHDPPGLLALPPRAPPV